MELTEEAKAELAEAVRILKEDGVHIHKSYAAFQKSLEPKPEDPPKEGDPPPVKDEPVPDPKPRKKGIGLWGASE